jgi:hypothetical protein
MSAVGAPLGNKNASSGKQVRDAIRKALARDKQALERVIAKVFEMAEGGDMAAVRELFDRIDGKAHQTTDNTHTVFNPTIPGKDVGL